MKYLMVLMLCILCLGCAPDYVPEKGDTVEVISGFHKGFKGKVVDMVDYFGKAYIVSDGCEVQYFEARELKKIEEAL